MSKSRWLVPFLALLLGGCFVSKQALITPTNADFPLTKGSHFTESKNCAPIASVLGPQVCDKGVTYKDMATGIMDIQNGHYVIQYDANSNAVFSMPMMQNTGNPTFRMKGVGDGFYVLETSMDDPKAAKSAAPNPFGGAHFIHMLVQIKGSTMYEYVSTCEANGDRHYVTAGKLVSITDEMGTPFCFANNLANLGAILRERVAGGEQPDERFDFK